MLAEELSEVLHEAVEPAGRASVWISIHGASIRSSVIPSVARDGRSSNCVRRRSDAASAGRIEPNSPRADRMSPSASAIVVDR